MIFPTYSSFGHQHERYFSVNLPSFTMIFSVTPHTLVRIITLQIVRVLKVTQLRKTLEGIFWSKGIF